MDPTRTAAASPGRRGPRASRVALGLAAALGLVAAPAWLLGVRGGGNPDALWAEAKVEFEGRRFDRAGALLDRVARLRPPTPLDHMLRAQLEIAAVRPEAALADLDAVPDGHPMAAQARLESGQIELRRDRFVPAERSFRRAVALDPKLVGARRELVYILGTQLRRAELDANFRALAAISPLTYPEVFSWCLTRGVSWEPLELIGTLGRALKADPDDRWSRLGLAESLREVGKLDEAEATLAPLGPDDPDARAARIRIALARGDDGGVGSLLAAGPADHLGLALLRGQLALVRQDGPEALRQYRIADRIAPHTREPAFGLGQALRMAGDAAGAAPYLEEARRHDRLGTLVQRAASEANRADPALVRDLGDACFAVGRFPEARAWYRIATDRDPLDARAQQGVARVDQAIAAADTSLP